MSPVLHSSYRQVLRAVPTSAGYETASHRDLAGWTARHIQIEVRHALWVVAGNDCR